MSTLRSTSSTFIMTVIMKITHRCHHRTHHPNTHQCPTFLVTIFALQSNPIAAILSGSIQFSSTLPKLNTGDAFMKSIPIVDGDHPLRSVNESHSRNIRLSLMMRSLHDSIDSTDRNDTHPRNIESHPASRKPQLRSPATLSSPTHRWNISVMLTDPRISQSASASVLVIAVLLNIDMNHRTRRMFQLDMGVMSLNE